MLEVRGIQSFYGPVQGLFDVDLTVGRGEMVSLMGRNGMGKTTTVRAIMGLNPVRCGRVSFEGKEIHRLPVHRIARAGIGLVPEGRQIFHNLTVEENLAATARKASINGKKGWSTERIFALFPQLKDRTRLMGSQLSGGEQQMLAIGRALMTHPRLLILDEATEGLAPRIRSTIWQVLAYLKSEGLSILVIDKQLESLLMICDRHYIIEKGRIAWQGTSRDLTSQPEVCASHLGI